MKRYRWAWRMLPHLYRFALLCAHRRRRHHPERAEMAVCLHRMRRASR